MQDFINFIGKHQNIFLKYIIVLDIERYLRKLMNTKRPNI
jgi:hypothetical protein